MQSDDRSRFFDHARTLVGRATDAYCEGVAREFIAHLREDTAETFDEFELLFQLDAALDAKADLFEGQSWERWREDGNEFVVVYEEQLGAAA